MNLACSGLFSSPSIKTGGRGQGGQRRGPTAHGASGALSAAAGQSLAPLPRPWQLPARGHHRIQGVHSAHPGQVIPITNQQGSAAIP